MITSSEKQSDKEVETSFVHLMQMPDVHVCHKGIAEVKISFMHIDKVYSQQKATQMLRGEHSTRPLGDTYQVQMSGTRTK